MNEYTLSAVIDQALSACGLWEIRTSESSEQPITLESEAYTDLMGAPEDGSRTLITASELWQKYCVYFKQPNRLLDVLDNDEDDGEDEEDEDEDDSVAFVPPAAEHEKWKQGIVEELERKRKNSATPEYTPQTPSGYSLAKISSRSKDEHPKRLDMILLDFGDDEQWVWRSLVLIKDPAEINMYYRLINDANCEQPNSELKLPPLGTYVAVLSVE